MFKSRHLNIINNVKLTVIFSKYRIKKKNLSILNSYCLNFSKYGIKKKFLNIKEQYFCIAVKWLIRWFKN